MAYWRVIYVFFPEILYSKYICCDFLDNVPSLVVIGSRMWSASGTPDSAVNTATLWQIYSHLECPYRRCDVKVWVCLLCNHPPSENKHHRCLSQNGIPRLTLGRSHVRCLDAAPGWIIRYMFSSVCISLPLNPFCLSLLTSIIVTGLFVWPSACDVW